MKWGDASVPRLPAKTGLTLWRPVRVTLWGV